MSAERKHPAEVFGWTYTNPESGVAVAIQLSLDKGATGADIAHALRTLAEVANVIYPATFVATGP